MSNDTGNVSYKLWYRIMCIPSVYNFANYSCVFMVRWNSKNHTVPTLLNLLLDTPCAAGARSTSFPPAVPPKEVYLKQRFSFIRSRTSVQRPLIWCPNSHLVRSIMSMLRFWKFSSKSRKIRVRKRSLNRLIVLVSFINSDPFSDRPKSKAQTAGRQEPRTTLQILFTKINYFVN